jgi:nucleoside phosphorylase
MTDVLVLAAHAVELEGLAPLLRESVPPGRASVVQLGERRVACAAVGVGLTAAGAGTARALIEHAPRAVVLMGSFGRYPHSSLSSSPDHAYAVERVRLADAAVALGKAAFPAPMPAELALDGTLLAALERHGALRIDALATTLSITTDDELAGTLGERSGCDGENLEALAVAQACAAARVPCAVHHADAARSTARVLEAFLSAR